MDSQATLEYGVVVQISGELSNDGQPMRHFIQTFILAPKAPKQYYIHNDIFRYQDVMVDSMGTADTSNTSRDNGGTTTSGIGMEKSMEPPSPQCIGRKFVGQYYTLLHKSPLQLHR